MKISHAAPAAGFLEKSLAADKELEISAKNIAETFLLPESLTISFEECDDEASIAQPKKIKICYGLLRRIMDVASKNDSRISPQSLAHYMVLHMSAHYLVELFELKGEEITEASYDELVSLMLLAESEKIPAASIEDMARLAAWFSGNADKLADVGFLVTHAPDKARADSLACNIYASDTQKFSALIGVEGLSEEAAAKCLEQLNQMQDNWSHILRPHLRYAEQSVE